MSHTPGPWSYQTFTRLKEGDKPMQIITAGDGTGWKGEQYLNVTGIISEDDARLIAAAPDLLEALEEAHSYAMESTAYAMKHAEWIANVIAKAKGEA